MEKRKNKRRGLFWLVLALLLAAIAANLYVSKYALTVSEYTLEVSGIQEPIRVVLLSDLHSAEFGDDNRRLLEKVAGQNPDLIFLVGDLVSETDADASVAVSLIERLCAIAPVYASLGNHELAFDTAHQTSTEGLYSAAGATVLERAYADVTVRGTTLRIGGLYGSYELAYGPDAHARQTAFLQEFQDTDRIKLLLCHIPTAFKAWGGLDSWAVDVVFSGHFHGGQVRLPFLGAVYAPELGLFPGKLTGVYTAAGGQALALSRGLGGGAPVPRFGNIPEIVSIILISD